MPACAACGKENPEGFRYCGFCAAPLGRVPSEEERKVVTVLFCDLAGFTARSDRIDPEDVRATTRPYHERVKEEVERFGGTVEKYVGDAVMAVFGAPVAHEDDAERAVRSALSITGAIEALNRDHPGLDLSVRVAVHTGEALVALTARPELGEVLVAGDVVNTASRLQQMAPVGAVVVGEGTYKATKERIQYEELPPARVKGKAEPQPIWRAVAALSRFGAAFDPDAGTVFVGRDSELRLLEDTFSRTLGQRSVQLVTVVGDPGVGKTRLIAEFARFVEAQREPVHWRQGRCLPYGDGVTFWAVGEIVKAHAGVLESDGPVEAAEKLAEAIDNVVELPSERQWMKNQLAALVGLAPSGAGSIERGELFAAWSRFLEGIGSDRPTVLVLEDLHWADPLMLEFVVRFAESDRRLPMLVLGTTRPELYDAHPGWPGTIPDSVTIPLPSLTNEETAKLISSLLGRSVLSPEMQDALLEGCGGNPLYARQFVRMLADTTALDRRDRAVVLGSEGDIAVPETVQALISARLDALSPLHKSLLQDAAVVGKVFWASAVAQMQRIATGEVEWRLHELARKELVRRSRGSSIAGESEYAFHHILIRDVAYRRIPRADRVSKHRAVAEWIEAIAPDRVIDHAEILAYHYTEALRIAGALGLTGGDVGALVGRAVRALVSAGDRAIHLDVGQASGYYRRGLDLLGPGDPMLGLVLTKVAGVADVSGMVDEAERMHRQAVDVLRERGDRLGTGNALVGLADHRWGQGAIAEVDSLLGEAIGLLEREPAGYGLALAYLLMARQCWQPGRHEESLEWAEKGLALAEQLKIGELIVRGMNYVARAWLNLGDSERGLRGMREALRTGLDLGVGNETARVYNNLSWTWPIEGPASAIKVLREGVEFGERRGLAGMAMSLRESALWPMYDVGLWDELLSEADKVISWARHNDPRLAIGALACKARVLVRRGEAEEAIPLKEEFLKLLEGVELWPFMEVLAISALVDQAAGDIASAVGYIEEIRDKTQDFPYERLGRLPIAVSVLAAAGATELAPSFLEGVAPKWVIDTPIVAFAHAVLEEAEGFVEEAASHYAQSADQWKDWGMIPYRADALLAEGRCLLALGKRDEGVGVLEEARSLFRGLGARPSIVDTESSLERARASWGASDPPDRIGRFAQ